MAINLAIMSAVLVVALLLWSKRVRNTISWRAMTTPLASIIGSGFLVLGPILDSEYGRYAPLVMAALCLGAYLFGAAIRYNMRHLDIPGGSSDRFSLVLDSAASWSLGFAYIISVAYYLNLLGAFGVSLTPVNNPESARILTSAVFVIILFVGWSKGFKSLESMEYFSVTTKLAIIAGLLLGLGLYFAQKAQAGALIFNPMAQTGWGAVTLAFGLIVTVQGFETSRYLRDEYDEKTLIRSMKGAQWLSSLIYMVYIILMVYVFERGELELKETAIVDMMLVVAPILPVLLVAAALAAQFSAAVADTSGCGGLVAKLTAHRVSPRLAYLVLTLLGLGLTWFANVFQIISYASRAFALYYTLQACLAARTALRNDDRLTAAGFGLLAVLGLLIILFGQSVESH